MPLLWVFGLNYQTANFEVRDKLAFSSETIPITLKRIYNAQVVHEILILSTCNRTEIYCVTQDIDFVINAICDIQNICPRTVMSYCYKYSELDCAKHLFRVISGLESMVLGETEIVSQIKMAFKDAQEYGTIKDRLIGLFQVALNVEKDVRHSTEINNIGISIGRAVNNLVIDNSQEIKGILFIGAGQMMMQVAPHFKSFAAKKTIINRTYSKAEDLALKTNADSAKLINLPDIINNYNVIIASNSSSSPFLDAQILENFIKNNLPLLIIDLSMPLVTNLEITKFNNIQVFTIDDIAKIVDVGVEKRKIAAIEAGNIINKKLSDYQALLKKRKLTPIIKALRDDAESARLEMLALAQKQLAKGEDPTEVIKAFSVKLTNKLLHNPTVNLSNKLDNDLTSLVCNLYNLEVKN